MPDKKRVKRRLFQKCKRRRERLLPINLEPRKVIPRKILNIPTNHILNLSHDARPYLLAKVNHNKHRGLLDSGAQASLMNEKTYEKMKEDGLKLEKFDVFISTCDGTPHKALGYVNVPYVVRKVKRIIPTLVVSQMEADLILGIDFWNAYKIKPCFTQNTYVIREPCRW